MSLSFKIDNNIGIIEFDREESKVNLLTFDVVRRFDEILDEISQAGALKLRALVIVSAKPNIFIAGADIKEIERITEPDDGEAKAHAGQTVFNKLEDLKLPTIALIDGVALGGGCELVLACGYRIATFNEKVRIGLPEVNLGIIPGFGGTYRLPRLVGLAEGMKMILSGKPVDGRKAFRIGLVDRLVPQKGQMEEVRRFIDEIHSGKTIPHKYKRKRGPKGIAKLFSGSLIYDYLVFSQSRKSVMKISKGFYPAPLEAIEVVAENFYTDRTEGLDIEAKAFGKLSVTDISKNLVKVFYVSEKYRKLTVEGTDGVKPAKVMKCGVCGAGIMGGGIAQLLSYKGIWVRLKDIRHDAVAQGFRAAGKLFSGLVQKRRITESQARQGMARITGTLDYSGFSGADLVIEAVIEKMEVKKSVFRELSDVTGGKAILATNTSALSVTELAGEVKDPSKVIGLHFFNPVHKMPLVEIITTPQTSKETLVTTLEFAKRLGKTPILVKDSCGFVVNRILLGYINEAGRLFEECGQIERIDRLMTDFGMPMGPFALSDEVGLDVGLKVMCILHEGLGERFKPVNTFDRVFHMGYLGKKSGKGFYVYGSATEPNETVLRLFDRNRKQPFNGGEYVKRMVYIMINEAARCLEDGIVGDPADIDCGMIFGTGFPPFRGGLLRYADDVGIDRIKADLKRFASQWGAERFEPCAYLRELKNGFYQ